MREQRGKGIKENQTSDLPKVKSESLRTVVQQVWKKTKRTVNGEDKTKSRGGKGLLCFPHLF